MAFRLTAGEGRDAPEGADLPAIGTIVEEDGASAAPASTTKAKKGKKVNKTTAGR